MSRKSLKIPSIRLPRLGLVLQLFAVILLPLTLLLVAITFGSLTIHQNAMRSLVGERDARLVRTAANALSAQAENRLRELSSIAQFIPLDATQALTSTISRAAALMPDFDLGVAVFTSQGKLLAAPSGEAGWLSAASRGQDWAARFSSLTTPAGKLGLFSDPQAGEQVGLIAARTQQDAFLVGAFSFQSMIEQTLADFLPSDSSLSVLLVSANRQVLYRLGGMGDQTADHPGVSQGLLGHSGTIYVKKGSDEHVTAYSPVLSTGWVLLTEESWEAVTTPTLRTTQVAPLVLVPAVLIMLLALWLGARQVVVPLRSLEARAATLVEGNFNTIQQPVGGIAEIQHLQNELIHMANKVKEAQRSLHSYIGVITSAQEDERKRLARELHDDTLQALIALQQRVQLAQLELQPAGVGSSPEAAKLEEISALTGQTIDNLRRLTRALRPAYLEDLGLVPALEMLARETVDGAGLSVEFQHLGLERRLDPAVELSLYRMAQEALSNVSRHARAKQASLTISYSPTEVVLMVVDDGVGFNLPASPLEYSTNGHYGLLGLRERVELIGARLEIQSSPGKGTRLVIRLPN